MENLLAMILAGGQGSRLQPLTQDRAKPAVHFAGKYRVIDFVLNNFVNSGCHRIKVLTQFKSDSLNQHIATAWQLNRNLDQYVDLVPAQMRMGMNWYTGTADAIYQNVNLIRDVRPDHVAVFGGDHVYKMDIRQMMAYHMQKSAVATISAIPVPISEAYAFGIVEVDEEGRMIGFDEKPAKAKEMPGRPGWALASMGNYIFNSKFLVRELLSDSKLEHSQHDFGRDILPAIYNHHPVYVYDFQTNRVRGEAFNFSRLGTHLERADNTARILDVKYHVLLPSVADVGGALDFYQWTALLRSVSAFESYRQLYRDQIYPIKVAQLLILERRMPRSLAACFDLIKDSMDRIEGQNDQAAKRLAYELHARLTHADIDEIFQSGLHEYLNACLADIGELGSRIERAYLGAV
jgi:ADP-glucose pyrophosphorylase